MISGKFYDIWSDDRFPLASTGKWQPLTGQSFDTPTGQSIYLLSGYGSRYVGADKDGSRPFEHRNELKRTDHSNPYMQRVVNKYGLSGFYYQPLCEVPAELIPFRDNIENAYIRHFDTYKNGYNCLEFAGTALGRKHSNAVKEKIGSANRGKVRSLAVVKAMRLASIRRAKPVRLQRKSTGEICEAGSRREFARHFRVNNGSLGRLLAGKIKRAGDFILPK